jgi:uncharacterized protein YkwD
MRWIRFILRLLNQPPKPPIQPPGNEPVVIDDSLLLAHNELRKSMDIPPLLFVASLDAAADNHSQQMARRDRLYHSNTYSKAENVAQTNSSDVESVMRLWMSSRGHRRNILDSRLKRVGFGAVENRSGKVYWTVNFG